MKSFLKGFALSLLAIALLGLGTGCDKNVKRISVDETKDLSGRWNDTDSRLVSEEMIKDATERPWIGRFEKANGRKPVLIVGSVVNKGEEHINTQTFVKDLERALINEDRVIFVTSSEERSGVRAERDEMAVNSTEPTRKAPRQETGADYMIIGQINTIFDSEDDKRVAFYQVELEAVDMRNNQKVWVGQKKVKKYIDSHGKRF